MRLIKWILALMHTVTMCTYSSTWHSPSHIVGTRGILSKTDTEITGVDNYLWLNLKWEQTLIIIRKHILWDSRVLLNVPAHSWETILQNICVWVYLPQPPIYVFTFQRELTNHSLKESSHYNSSLPQHTPTHTQRMKWDPMSKASSTVPGI